MKHQPSHEEVEQRIAELEHELGMDAGCQGSVVLDLTPDAIAAAGYKPNFDLIQISRIRMQCCCKFPHPMDGSRCGWCGMKCQDDLA